MDKVFIIRHKVLVGRRSIRSVAREMGISRNTVSKYLEASEPVRQPSVPRPRPAMDKVAARIDEILSQWSGRLTSKQRLTGFYAACLDDARDEAKQFLSRYSGEFPSAAKTLTRHLEECLAFYCFPERHWKHIRTSNVI